jgi:hypothetical protein
MRPRVRLREGADPTAAIDRLYRAQQLDKPTNSVRLMRSGEMVGTPVGLPDRGEPKNPERNQFPEDKHGPGYDDDVRGWARDGGDDRPAFDRRGHHFKAPRGLEASGKDMTKSPFSAAGRNFKRRGEQ